jgi:hypothetical protein
LLHALYWLERRSTCMYITPSHSSERGRSTAEQWTRSTLITDTINSDIKHKHLHISKNESNILVG